MKNNFYFIFCLLIINLLLAQQTKSAEEFNFDVTEAEIIEDGNKFLGKKRGIATSDDDVTIEANNFEYDKILNILKADGDVIVNDKKTNLVIYTDKVTYLKNKEIIFTENNSKAIRNGTIITAENFKYYKLQNILNANDNVEINDTIDDYLIFSNNITYQLNKEEIFSKGMTNAIIQSKYDFQSKDVTLDRNLMELSSSKNTIIKNNNNFNIYKLTKFKYFYNEELLKGKNLEIITNDSKKNLKNETKNKSDKYYFDEAFINFKNNKFVSKNTKMILHKSLLDEERDPESNQASKFIGKNDPRLSSVSSTGDEDKTILNKAVFTSCERNDNCPPWSIEAQKITHDKIKKEIIYKNAILNIYDVPVFYFPKFFHPDPSVKRRSGLLQPRLNNSNILGTSINIPYFKTISESKDITFKPTIFDNRIYMFQNEYRQENKSSSFIADFSYTKGYKSTLSNNRNSISHLFAKYDLDLGLKNFVNSKLKIFAEKVNNDTYLKVFENVLLTDKKFENDLKDKNNLTSGMELSLDHEDYNFTSGLTVYENLQSRNNDRYQHVFPYYNFSKSLFSDTKGSINFASNGKNVLSKTNNLRSNVTNDVNYVTSDLYTKQGFVNNFGIYFSNLNIMGKNDDKYKSSLQSELLNIYEVSSNLPLMKVDDSSKNFITPKISFRVNPSDMKDYSLDSRLITANNIFDINRLSVGGSYESGKSITVGVDFKREDIGDPDKFFEAKFASVLRDENVDNIPVSSTINRKTSNLFGSIENSFTDFFTLNYDFSLDNDLSSFEYNSINAEFKVDNFTTNFNFMEKNGEVGDLNTLENTTSINFDENNSLLFNTRRNRKISLTEYYDLIYEYQNDCLTAGIKYRKTYYQDRDLRPKEDLFFTITLFPLTSLDQKINPKLYRDDTNELTWK